MKKHPLADCDNCPLQSAKFAPTVGPSNADLAIVSRSPSKGDTIKGTAFSGPTGKVLDHLLESNDVNRNDVLLTNVVLCRCDEVPKEAIKCCAPRLESDLANVNTVIAAGREAASALAGAANITSSRGIVHRRNNKRIIVSANPAVVLRDSRSFSDLVKDFKLAINPTPEPKMPEVNWTNDPNQARRWFREFLKHRPGDTLYSCDIESRGLTPDAPIVAFGISIDGHKAISVGEHVCKESWFLRDYLRPFLTKKSPQYAYLWHNGKFDCKVLRWMDISARIDEDTILLSYALDEVPGRHSLEYLCRTELGWPDYEPEIVKHFKKNSDRKNKDGSWFVPVPDELYPYNALDCAGVALLFPILKARAEIDNVVGVYEDLLKPSSHALIHVESSGICYNTDKACDILEDEVWPEISQIRQDMQNLLHDEKYNPASSQQNANLVYDAWKCNHAMTGRRGKERSVDESAYNELIAGRFITKDPTGMKLSEFHPQFKLIQEWATMLKRFKQLDKQRSNYLEGLVSIAEKRPDTRKGIGRIYGNFNNINTVSGRLGSDKPNMQNITRPKDGLPNIRRLIVSSDGRLLISADYSQAELRTLGVISGDTNLLHAYEKGLDLHAIAAERFYGANWTKEDRSHAKNMNFGVAYDQSPETFQEKHDIPVHEAREFVDWWWKEHPGVKVWRDSVHQMVKRDGEVVTLFGRKRRFPLLTKENYGDSMREAVNFLIQSTAHDFTLWSLIKLIQAWNLDPIACRYIIEGHDSIVADCHIDLVDMMSKTIKTVMESAAKATLGWTLPFTVEVAVGENWSDVKEIEI